MNNLNANQALLIAGSAFAPFKCVATQPQDGNPAINLSIIDRTYQRLGQALLDTQTYKDPAQLANALAQSREQLSRQGYVLEPWTMPA